jgi:DNA-binding CsgD family transcriptional regulator
MTSRSPLGAVFRPILLYGIGGGLLITVMRAVEYRWLVVEHSLEIYGGLVAAVFAGVGIWLGRKLTRERVVVCQVPVTVEVPVEVPAPATFVRDERQLQALAITARELEVLELIAAGHSTREIAERLFVSESTVKTHSSRVFEKLGASRRTQAVQKAREFRLIP